jgi:hypothetical protein
MAPLTTSRSVRSERGAALVEFALALPLLLVVIGGIVDFGFLFQRYEVLTNAAREGARLGSLPGYIQCPGGVGAATAPGVEARVRDYVAQGLAFTSTQVDSVMPAGSVDITCDTMAVAIPGSGTINISTVRVELTYTHSFIMLGPVLSLINASWGTTMDLTAASEMRLEAGAAPPPPGP